jgi:hypothetical protein
MNTFKQFLAESWSTATAKKLGDSLGVDWSKISLNQFKMGLDVESEHDTGGVLDVVKNHKDLAKIVLAHLSEVPDYYTKLKKVEEDAPANSVGAGGIAGLREPIVRKTNRKKPAFYNK